MKLKRFRLALPAAALALLLSILSIQPTQSQTGGESEEISVSNVQNQHNHLVGFRTADLAPLIAALNSDTDAVAFESSTGFDGGPPNGRSHSHTVLMKKSDLVALQNSGTASVQSESSLNHTHVFTFINKAQCSAAGAASAPEPAPSPPPGPSPTVTPGPPTAPAAPTPPMTPTTPTTPTTPAVPTTPIVPTTPTTPTVPTTPVVPSSPFPPLPPGFPFVTAPDNGR